MSNKFSINAGKGNNTNIDNTDSMDLTTVVDNVIQTDTSHVEEFNVEIFFKLISNDLTKINIGNMLHYMSESMTTNFEKHKVQGNIIAAKGSVIIRNHMRKI